MTTTIYSGSNGAIVADDSALISILSTNLPSTSGKRVILYNAVRDRFVYYDPSATSGDFTPSDSPSSGRWFLLGSESLRANRTYYVRSDGSDSNNGLANTSGGAFLTWAKALTVISTLNCNGFVVTIQGNGSFASTNNIIINQSFVGLKKLIIQGDTTTPSNCTINAPLSYYDYGLAVNTTTPVEIKGIKFSSSATASDPTLCLTVLSGVASITGNCDFGNAGGGNQIYVTGNQSHLKILTPYTISGSGSVHLSVFDQGFIESIVGGIANTISGSISFAAAFAIAARSGSMSLVSVTYSGGSVSGSRYSVDNLSGIWALGSTVFAGSSSGTTTGSGYYGS